MTLVIQIVGMVNGMPTPHDGKYLREYDATRSGIDPDGVPWIHLVTTPDKQEAQKFDDLLSARACWMQIDLNNPVRPDGRPNRPMTIFSITLESA